MIVLSNQTSQTLQPGESVTFDRVVLKTGCCECFNRQLNKSVKLKCNGVYDLSFSGNVTSTTAGAAVQLSISVAGQPLVETVMNATITAAGDIENISTKTGFNVCCCDMDRVSVINTGTIPVTLNPMSSFVVNKCS